MPPRRGGLTVSPPVMLTETYQLLLTSGVEKVCIDSIVLKRLHSARRVLLSKPDTASFTCPPHLRARCLGAVFCQSSIVQELPWQVVYQIHRGFNHHAARVRTDSGHRCFISACSPGSGRDDVADVSIGIAHQTK